MTPHETLGLDPTATLEEIKAAYRAKLKEFPAHSHPQEFKAVRAAYETLRKQEQGQYEDFLAPRPLKPELDPELLKSLQQHIIDQADQSLEDLIRLSF